MRDKIVTTEAKPEYAPHVALVGAQVFFGSLPAVAKIALGAVPAFALVGARVGTVALALFFARLGRGGLRLAEPRDYPRFFALSFLGVTLNQLLFIGGLSLTKAANASLLAVTIPIFTVAFGAALGAERLRARKIIGILLAAAGVVLLIDPRGASFSPATTVGDLMIVLNSLSYGLFVVLSKDSVARNGAVKSTAWVFIFASFFCVPLGVFSLAGVEVGAVPPSVWLSVFYVAVGGTLFPYLLNAHALARVSPSVVAVYIYLQPLIGFLLAVIFLGERPGSKTFAAAALVFAGLFFAAKRPAA